MLWEVRRHTLHGVDGLQTSHVHDDPEDIGLTHEQGKDTKS